MFNDCQKGDLSNAQCVRQSCKDNIKLYIDKLRDKTLIHNIDKLTELGEGQFIEFKESLDKSFSKEVVAFANASGGIVYLGITDTGNINRGYKQAEISNTGYCLQLRPFYHN